MRTGVLLEELINIARTPKTDFALSMRMTPSGLSKILTGKRLPLWREKRMFSRQAANYFSEIIYRHDCYRQFEKLFPILYDFNSKYELEMFLAYAIEYTLEKDHAEENDEYLDYPTREAASFLGEKTTLNMFCIIVSDYIISNKDALSEVYSTLPLFNRRNSGILGRAKMLSSPKMGGVSLNYFFDMASFEASCHEYNMGLLFSISNLQKHVDLNLWKVKEAIGSTFLLLKGQCLLIFSTQISGTPLMTFITLKSHLDVFFNALMRKEAVKISYNKSEAIAALEADPSFIDSLINRRINAVYNFISIGYMIEKEELKEIKNKEAIKKAILKLFNEILTKQTTFFVTLDAMMNFCATGKAIVPLFGAIDMSPDQRIPYLQRFNSFIGKKDSSKMKLINSELPKVALLCLQGLTIIYLIDSEYSSEKIHYFETDEINQILEHEITNGNIKMLDFSPDLWNTYIDELSKDIYTPTF